MLLPVLARDDVGPATKTNSQLCTIPRLDVNPSPKGSQENNSLDRSNSEPTTNMAEHESFTEVCVSDCSNYDQLHLSHNLDTVSRQSFV